MLGKVKYFKDDKGFGFINSTEVTGDIFVHFTQIVADGYKTLKTGDEVEFELVETDKGYQAKNVKKLG